MRQGRSGTRHVRPGQEDTACRRQSTPKLWRQDKWRNPVGTSLRSWRPVPREHRVGGSRCPFFGRRPGPREARPLPSIGWLAHRQRPTGLPSQAPGLQLWFIWSHDALATPAVSVQDVGATVPHRRPAQRALPARVQKGFWGVRDRAFSPPLRRTFFFPFSLFSSFSPRRS